jgi:Ca2+-binding RTX toxin-like protein
MSADSLSAAKHNLILNGNGNLVGYGNSLRFNKLDARQNSGNTTLFAGPSSNAVAPASSLQGPSSTTLLGGSGNDVLVGWTGARTQNPTISAGSTGTASRSSTTLTLASASQFFVGQTISGAGIASGTTIKSISGNTITLSAATTAAISNGSIIGYEPTTPPAGFVANTDWFIGGAGSSTMFAGNVASTLSGGALNNLLVADTYSGANQSLWGGNNTGGALYGNTLYGGTGKDTLRSGTGYNTLISGSTSTLQGNTLIGGGVSNSLIAGSGNDSLIAISGVSTLLGGTGNDTLIGSTVVGSQSNWLQSGSSLGGGNTVRGGTGISTIVAGLGRDSIVGGVNQNLLLITSAAQAAAFAADSISLSTLSSASNTLGLSSATPVNIGDTLFATMATARVTNLGTVVDLPGQGNASQQFILGQNAEKVGVHTLVAGLGQDTLSVAGYTNSSVLLDGSRGVNRASLVGGGTGNDTFLGSRGGYDTIIGAAGDDSIVVQASALAGSSFGLINGGAGTDTLFLSVAASLSGTNFNGVSNIEVLRLGNGNNSVGSLQGSGIQKIIGNTGSDTLSANVYGAVRSVTLANSSTVTLNVTPGTSATMGFAAGQVVTGNGIAVGTTITGVSSTAAVGSIPGTVTLTLSRPTTSLISQGGAITGWLSNATLDGSLGLGFPPTNAETLRASTAFTNAATSITAANYGQPFELGKDTLAISTLKNDPSTYIHRKGDYLVSYGQNDLLVGGQGNGLPDLDIFGGSFTDKSSQPYLSVFLNTPDSSFLQHQVVDNTLISGSFASNTLKGGSGNNLYLINNQPGATSALPTIQNPTSLQSASTIQFTGNGVNLTDTALSSVSARAAQKIVTANGNNLISIGQNAAQIGIQTIIGGVGADTFTTTNNYIPSVFFDASKGAGNESLAAGSGNDTLLGGNGNATIVGGDGNNSLIGGSGNNLILSGVGNSTLDSGLGVSTLQADGGLNTFVVRNRNTRILNPYSLERDSVTGNITPPNPVPVATTPEVGIVNSYVNFDPIQSTQVNQFAPTQPDGSPSITKSPSFASSDLSSFFNLQYFNLMGSAAYGVGNALDNTMTSAAANALMLGMGGNNTLVGNGANTSLYGYVNSTYANPDLYAAAPFDTRDQYFIDGVIGVAGNNSLVANGANSYLDAGPGYNDGLNEGSGSNTMVGTGGDDTFIVHNQADVVVASATTSAHPTNELISTVDLHSIADNINRATLLVTSQAPDLPNINPNLFPNSRPTLAPNSGQTDPATFLGFGNGAPSSKFSDGFVDGSLNITLASATRLDVQYGTAEGEQYESDQGSVVPPSGFNSLNVGPLIPDPQNPSTAVATTLSWSAPTTGGAVVGYTVNYRVDNGDGTYGAWKTYVNGTSQDMTGTSSNPSLTVDGLPTLTSGQSYDFRVTAQQLTLPTTTDPYTGLVSAKPVTLQGSNNNDVIWSFMPAETLFGGALVGYNSNAPILTNNPYGAIPVPTQPSQSVWDRYPVYMDAQNGSDLFVTQQIGNGDGSDYTVGGITFTGLDTMVGGIGSDTFIVSNSDTTFNNGVVTNGPNGFDLCIKYGNETPVNYSNVAPSTPAGIGTTGVSLNGGQHNLIISDVAAIQLSSTVVAQGKFVDELLVNGSGRFGEGNNLDNFIYDMNASKGANTLVGYTGRDSIVGAGGKDLLIGGTATGTDSIAGALADFSNGNSTSIYRDTDPTPTNALTGGPGLADPSQYWTQNGRLGGLVYNYLGNSDTLISTGGATMDGGAGADSMVGAGGDTFYISSGGSDIYYDNAGVLTNRAVPGLHSGYSDGYQPVNAGSPVADVVSEAGGTGTIVYTGSDVFWSGLPGATKAVLGYALSGTAISNITLQKGDAIARYATGSASSTGNDALGGVAHEVGSNVLIGNEYGATLNGGGVGGGDGTGIGLDSLVGNAGNSTRGYAVSPSPAGTTIQSVTGTADTFQIGSNYTGSAQDAASKCSTDASGLIVYKYMSRATDLDYAIIDARGSKIDSLNSGTSHQGATIVLGGAASNYVIGAASSFAEHNLVGGTIKSDDFGIYLITTDKTNKDPSLNLVAEVKGMPLDAADQAYISNTANAYYDTVNRLSATGVNSPTSMGGTDFAVNGVTYANIDASNTAQNFAGMGAFYSLTSTDFYHQHIA